MPPQDAFHELKEICVPLLENSSLTPPVIPRVLSLLSSLNSTLQKFNTSGHVLAPSLVSYVIFPLTSIFRRNASSAIPDQVLERSLNALSLLCEGWWWDCDLRAWEQLFMLCGAIIGGIEGKGKGKDRDDETKDAAVRCLFSLTRKRDDSEDPMLSATNSSRARDTFAKFQTHGRSSQFVPILGQTIDSLIVTAGSRHLSLQRRSLQVLRILVAHYAADDFVPSILPGVVSAMTRVVLGVTSSKGWTNGDIVADALPVMQEIITRSIADEVCLKEGAIRGVTDLDDLVDLMSESQEIKVEVKPFSTSRTPTWLRATSAQLHIALNTLTPLVSHPTPAALSALSAFSSTILASTALSLPQSQPLFLSFLLSLSQSPFESVSTNARNALQQLLVYPSKIRHSLLQTLLQTTRDNLAALPRLLPSHSDQKVEHIAGQVEAVCRLATSGDSTSIYTPTRLSTVSTGIGKLLGPMGGIEKWGWRLLSVLEFDIPPFNISGASSAQLMLEAEPDNSPSIVFPDITLKHVSTRSTQVALERMFRALGDAAGDDCLFSVEWFISVGRNRRDAKGVAALWCACRLLEGISGISLSTADTSTVIRRNCGRRAQKIARGLVRGMAELWDEDPFALDPPPQLSEDLTDDSPTTEHVKGLISLDPSLQIGRVGVSPPRPSSSQPLLRKCLALRLLSISSAFLQAQFMPMLLYTLYPVLHSIVSPISYLSHTGLAALGFITSSMSYASPANLLLSNFDYALDAVSRRLTRQRLDIDATKVLAVLVRLVGHDVVRKAGDVVEECFDRLDEYHGYEVIVEGLVEVLGEVVKVVEEDEENHATREEDPGLNMTLPPDTGRMDSFVVWFQRRHDPPLEENDTANYGPAPREPWEKRSGMPEEDQSPKAHDAPDPNAEAPPTPAQALTKQIVSRSMYFLTHGSPLIKARILTLLSSSVSVLPESALLPSIHEAWPFILNRLADTESFVVAAAAMLVESLSTHVGSFMFQRIWEDIWPRFKELVGKLDVADSQNALARRGPGGIGTESAYTHSHRLYRAMLKTMTATIRNVQGKDSSTWEMLLAFRRFLDRHAHEELQSCAVELYVAMREKNADVVWLVLRSTSGDIGDSMVFLREDKWDISNNTERILSSSDAM
ncbi:hypothetical protein EW146_g6745 [Bondarzewia mesenterica]|uniref:TEL2-interacting protein 1 n=1 Tax=Bondarzewia mesenterica TaxID=1095465 RepID=A0A4S4LNC9_9AGAM|nr:hypothetical protein EW146_g6745 [Bondarzewia mesenterica]